MSAAWPGVRWSVRAESHPPSADIITIGFSWRRLGGEGGGCCLSAADITRYGPCNCRRLGVRLLRNLRRRYPTLLIYDTAATFHESLASLLSDVTPGGLESSRALAEKNGRGSPVQICTSTVASIEATEAAASVVFHTMEKEHKENSSSTRNSKQSLNCLERPL